MCGCASAPGDMCPSTQAGAGYDLPCLQGDASKFSMAGLSGGMHTCGGHSCGEGFHEAPSARREPPGQVQGLWQPPGKKASTGWPLPKNPVRPLWHVQAQCGRAGVAGRDSGKGDRDTM